MLLTHCKLGSEGCMYTDTGSWDLRGVCTHSGSWDLRGVCTHTGSWDLSVYVNIYSAA